jgi:hypothetical protein
VFRYAIIKPPQRLSADHDPSRWAGVPPFEPRTFDGVSLVVVLDDELPTAAESHCAESDWTRDGLAVSEEQDEVDAMEEDEHDDGDDDNDSDDDDDDDDDSGEDDNDDLASDSANDDDDGDDDDDEDEDVNDGSNSSQVDSVEHAHLEATGDEGVLEATGDEGVCNGDSSLMDSHDASHQTHAAGASDESDESQELSSPAVSDDGMML